MGIKWRRMLYKRIKFDKKDLTCFLYSMLGAWLLLSLPFILKEAFAWTSFIHGILNGISFSIFAYGFICLLLTPLFFVGVYLTKWKCKKLQIRVLIMLFPILVYSLYLSVGFIRNLKSNQEVFQELILSRIPKSVSNIKLFHSGGGFADTQYIIYFEVEPKDLKAMIRQCGFIKASKHIKLNNIFALDKKYYIENGGRLGPNPFFWENILIYEPSNENNKSKKGYFKYLIIEPTFKQAYFVYLAL